MFSNDLVKDMDSVEGEKSMYTVYGEESEGPPALTFCFGKTAGSELGRPTTASQVLHLPTHGGPTNALFLRADNFATAEDRKACNMSKVSEFSLEWNANLHASALKYSLPTLHKSPIPSKVHWIRQWRMTSCSLFIRNTVKQEWSLTHS